ncbi:MAG: hypothetical protein O3B84_05075 [Chloroflexi bacterium]|nr:hypothetical protein [Chloroflexota bacterium]
MADKFEREIEEIINRTAGDLRPVPRDAGRAAPRNSSGWNRLQRFSVRPGQVMFASVALLLVGVLLWNSSQGLGGMVMLGAVVLFLISYVLLLGKRAVGATGYEKRWRGDPIPDRSSTPLSVRLRKLLWRLRR